MTKRVFKIRDESTGLYSKGGSIPSWSKIGKTWTTEAALKNHLNLVSYAGYGRTPHKIPASWIVEVYELAVTETITARSVAERPAKK